MNRFYSDKKPGRKSRGPHGPRGFVEWQRYSSKARMRTTAVRYYRLRYTAQRRHIPCLLAEDEYQLLLSKPCYYCGGPLNETGGGLDRLDNTKGYVTGNAVSCCGFCNTAKSDMTIEQFRFLVSSILNYWLGYSIPTLEVDCSVSNLESREKRLARLKKKWHWLKQEDGPWWDKLMAEWDEEEDRLSGAKYKFMRCRSQANAFKIDFTLTLEDFEKLMDNPCYYCGGSLNRMGHTLDRINGKEGYVRENVRPCCKRCNMAKNDLTELEFKNKMVSIYNHWINPPSENITVQDNKE